MPDLPDHLTTPEDAKEPGTPEEPDAAKEPGTPEAAGTPDAASSPDRSGTGNRDEPEAARPGSPEGSETVEDPDAASPPHEPDDHGSGAPAEEASGGLGQDEEDDPDPEGPDPDAEDPDPEDPDAEDPDPEDPDAEDPDPEDPDTEEQARARRRPAGRGRDDGKDPAWRAALRGSRFGQVAVVLVAAFAIAIAAWWAVRPESDHQAQGQAAVVTQVDVEGAQTAPVAGSKAPAFTGTDIGAQEVSLDPQARGGKPVWLMFVATWCTGCRTEMPDVQEAVAAHGEDVEVIVVYVGEDRATVSAYSGRVGNDFTEIPDTSQSISAAYGVMGVPSHFFIDGDGTVRQVSVGILTPDQMAQALGELTGS